MSEILTQLRQTPGLPGLVDDLSPEVLEKGKASQKSRSTSSSRSSITEV